MRVILVDDEPLILSRFKKLVEEIEEIELIGAYNNPLAALEAIYKEQPDAVFLDIEMPEINGIEMAEKIQSNLPNTKLIFVTGYRDYAVEAFELNAVDYLLKPVQRARLQETVHRIISATKEQAMSSKAQQETMVCCFRSLQFKKFGEILNVRWRTAKARELFAFLLQYRQKLVRKDYILETLWPEIEMERGVTQLYSAIYQIRKTLATIGFDIAIISNDNSYILDLKTVKFDVDEWERQVGQLEVVSDDNLKKHHELVRLYRDDYLVEHNYLWAESERERLRALWLHHITKLTNFLVEKENYTGAAALYHLIQERYPYMEDSYFMLMQLYNELGDRNAVEQQYDSLIEILLNEYDTEPSASVKTWYQTWKKRNRNE